jgi:uncharacterized iron-regulated membrane protein
MSASHRFLKICRLLHLYLGVFMAPALLFFAITGGLQTFSLHETTKGSSYTPPAWLATAALLHKKQTTVAPVRRPRLPETEPPAQAPHLAAPSTEALAGNSTPNAQAPRLSMGAADHDGARPKKNLLPMKVFFALVALSLCLSTLTGLYMAYRYSRKPKLVSGILVAGIVVPLLLLLF